MLLGIHPRASPWYSAKADKKEVSLLKYTIFDTPVLRTVLRWISICLLKFSGWQTQGALPDIPKFVMLAAPHTSNWDFPIMMFIIFKLKGKLYWMGKDALFRKPFNNLFKWLGGIPIDRSRANNVVEQMVEKFHETDRFILTIPPSGTRKKVKKWKSGFYHIAEGAKVPVVLGFLDFKRKTGGVGPLVTITGDMEQDMQGISSFYADIEGKYPEKDQMDLLKTDYRLKISGIKS
jgi:1-acyl-sn-glycerol-3-phosphate acyltransferase